MLRDLIKKELLKITGLAEAKFTEPEREKHGDYTTNAAFKMGPPAGGAEKIAEKLRKSELVKEVAVKNKFINIFLKDEVLLKALSEEVKSPKKKEKINVEFVSANPTGPLTMANARGGFYGDALSNVLEKTGYDVTREFYINDAGNQVKLLGESIQAAEGKIPEKDEYYKGEYIKKLKGKTAQEAVEVLLGEIKSSLEKAGVKFGVWFSENEKLRKTGELDAVLKKFKTEKRDGAVWFASPAGEWVLVKSDGEATYFLADLAYHYDKFFKRKFDLAIDVWGADHAGHIERLKKGMAALGVNSDRLKIIIVQLVRLVSDGKEARMSKRTGEFVTMDELLEQVGLDAARWFFLARAPETHMDFDLDLAKERSEKNPVYYVQYAHTRMASILSKAQNTKYKILNTFAHPSERALVVKILRYPELLEDISKDYQVHRLTTYAYELAQSFSAFYRDVKVLGSEREAELLYLVQKAKETLADLLKLMGISPPEKM